MYQAKEGSGEGRLLAGFLPESWADNRRLLQDEELLIRGGVDPVISQKHRAKDGPNLDLGNCLVPACNGGDLMISHNQIRVRERIKGPAPQDSVPLPSYEAPL